MDIGAWLQGLGLGQYEAKFRENEVEADILPDLMEADLEKIGLPLGPRKRILKAIAKLGAPSAEPAPAPSPSTEADSAERRQLTVMFCDLVGSTALSARLDPEDMRRVIRAYQDAVSGVVARYDGFVAKFMGDGVLAYFGFPRAHEDDAARAVHAGLEIAQVVAGLSTPARDNVAARIGVATGLVVVGDIVGQGAAQEQAVVGDTPNLAARLQGLADAGGVVISAATRRLVGDGFRLENLGRHAVKGLGAPVEAWAALGVAATESRFEAAHAVRLTGLVGREAEAADLIVRQRRAWEGRGQIVLISGEAGIGKSRLAAWVGEQTAGSPHTRLRYQCSPYHRDSALYPFAQQFERAAGFSAQDSPNVKLDKLEKLLALATDRLDEVAPLIAAMLSIPVTTRYPAQNLSPAQQRRQTLFALLDQMEGLANKQPILMLFEDAHWADATSLEVLDLAIERMRKLPVLLLITFRPEFEASWKGLPDVAEIALGRLERGQVVALVGQVTGGRKLPAEVLAQIVAKTDGVPLFVEELTKNVLESGLLIEDGERYRLDGPLPPLAIPSTLQDSLMARLDRLAAVKEIAQIGAAIGREFSYALLQAVVGRDEATLRAALAQLEESELVFRAGEPPAARYTFKHALVQDTAYESLLKSRRQILHQRIAEALRDKFPVVVEAEPELIAEHFTRAGLTEPAIVHWGKAGDLALRRSAFKEAIAHLGKAIEMTEAGAGEKHGAGENLKLHVSYGNAMISVQGYGARETSAAFERARDIATGVEDVSERLSAQYGLWAGSFVRGELVAMRELSAALLRDCAERTLSGEAGVANRIAGATHWYAGEYVAARDRLELALVIFDPERHRELAFRFGQDPGVAAMAYSALVLWPLGEVALADQRIKQMMERAANIGHTATAAYGYFHAAEFELIRENPDVAARLARALIEITNLHQLAFWLPHSVWFDGWLEWRAGNRDAGLSGMRNGIARLAEAGSITFAPVHKIMAEAEAEAGVTDAALATIDHGIAESERTGQCWFQAELHRIRAQILLQQSPADPAPAEAAFLNAIAIAQSQKARSFELRAALALAKLYQSTGRPVEACDILVPALEGFSATPEFPQIAEAQALIDRLAQSDSVQSETASRTRRAQLQIALGNALFASRGWSAPETIAAFAKARELAKDVADPAERASITYGLWVGSFSRGELTAARELAETFLRDASDPPNSPMAGIAHRINGSTCMFAGDFLGARTHHERAVVVLDFTRDHDLAFRFGQNPFVVNEITLAVALWALGEVDESERLAHSALSHAETLGHIPTLAYVHMWSCAYRAMRRQASELTTHVEALTTFARAHAMGFHISYSNLLRGWLDWRSGAGVARIKEALVELRKIGFGVDQPGIIAALAHHEVTAGRGVAAVSIIDEWIGECERDGQRCFLAEHYRTRGEILLEQTPADAALAEAAFLTAISIARQQKARSFELRAALDLAKLYQAADREIEAHDVLAPALDGFSPTPEFPEIAEAKALHEKLTESDAVRTGVAARQQRLRLHAAYSQAVMWSKGFTADETKAAFARVDRLATETGDAEAALNAHFARWADKLWRGQLGLAREAAESLLRDAERAARPMEAAVAHRLLGLTLLNQGDIAGSKAHCEQTLRIYNPERDHEARFRFGQDPAIVATGYLSLAAWQLGDPESARKLADEARARAIDSAHAPTLATICNMQAHLEIWRGDGGSALAAAEASADIARDLGLALWRAYAALSLANARARFDARDAALTEFRRAVTEFENGGYKFNLPFYKGLLAEVEAARGGVEAALAGLDEALALAGENGEHWYDAELHRIRGGILLKQNPADPAAAEAAFRSAIAVARQQQARSFELRAALALAKLYQSTDRPVEAHDVLGPALEGFSPTPEFAEIGEAQALLSDLQTDFPLQGPDRDGAFE